MNVTKTGMPLNSAYEGGKTTFGIYIATEAHLDDAELNQAIESWVDGGDVAIEFRFSIRECVEDMIDWHRRLDAKVPTMGKEDRPAFDALRAELVAMVERIDGLRYAA